MGDPLAYAADALAASAEIVDAAADRVFGVIRAVNADGTVTVEDGKGTRPSVRCMRSYSPRAVGDTVLVLVTRAGPVVLGAVGSAVGPSFTLSDSAAPGGQGWEETVSGQVWAKTSGAQWMKRTVASPPPSGGSVTQSASTLVTYRGGGLTQGDRAEQGDYSGLGLQTGLATFGSWGGLSGHTATGGTLTIHRRGSGHGFTYGPVTATAYRCVASGAPASPPSLDPAAVMLTASLNETVSTPLTAAWCQQFCTGAATAVAFYSGNARDNIEIDAVTLTVSY